MLYGRIVEGFPREIAEKISQIVGERQVKVMLMDGEDRPLPSHRLSDAEFTQIMAEIEADAVSVPHVDDSREGIYTRQDGE